MQVHVPLMNSDPNFTERRLFHVDQGSELLPFPHLTATTIFGVRGTQADTLGQLYATQIATAISTKNPEEGRLLVLGLGLEDMQADSSSFVQVLELVLSCM